MRQNAIRPTKHAIDRFNDRVKPRLSSRLQLQLSCTEKLKEALSALCSEVLPINNGSKKEKIETLLYRRGKSPLRLALVIDLRAGVLITLWCLGVLKNYNRNPQPRRRLVSARSCLGISVPIVLRSPSG